MNQQPPSLLTRARPWLAAIVLVHAVVAAWHGYAHLRVPVPLAEWQTLYVAVVVVLLPLIGMALLWKSDGMLGVWIIALAMTGSLAFGFVHHYLLHSPDHVAFLEPGAWRDSFIVSAALVLATEAMGTIVGWVLVGMEKQT